MKSLYSVIIFWVLIGCHTDNRSEKRLAFFKDYFQALQLKDGSKWNFTSDTLRLWFDSKSSKPVTSIKGTKPSGKWAAWDSVMNASTVYDSIWYDESKEVVKGYFYERNDFYDLIGRPPNKTLRTYWFSDDDKIEEILIYWIPEENKTSSEFLFPIMAWARQHDKAEINYLYANETIEPSIENAIRWKALLRKYKHFQDSLNTIK